MAFASNVSVIDIRESVNFLPGGTAQRVELIRYTVGDDGPFTLTVTPENNTQQWIEGQINAKAAAIAALRGNG